MTGQGTPIEDRLQELTRSIHLLNTILKNYTTNTPPWHSIRDTKRELEKERNTILINKHAKKGE